MRILVFTNTYTPHIGGVARSVHAFTEEYRRRGHQVLIVAPQYPEARKDEAGVVRIPAIQKFNGSDFSVRLPIPGLLNTAINEFQPELVHSNHPFLLGDTALRVAAKWNVPLVFTHHTMYEHYTHYLSTNSPPVARFVISLATGYANLCDRVFAPSESVAGILRERGVVTPIEVVPTGIDLRRFGEGDGMRVRREAGIPPEAFVVGHVGRLAPEKNLPFLAEAVSLFLRRHRQAHFIVVGGGPSREPLTAQFGRMRLQGRLHLLGSRQDQALVDAYHAMDAFVFGSCTETQGLVLIEAMAAGVPVVAVDAPGVREVIEDDVNGRLLAAPQVHGFAEALDWCARLPTARRQSLQARARQTASRFDMPHCADAALGAFAALLAGGRRIREGADSNWDAALRWLETEWELLSNVVTAAQEALRPDDFGKIPGLGFLMRSWRRVRGWFSRAEWGRRLLRLAPTEGEESEPGLILIQIDGLSRNQFEAALRRRRMPFLRRLIAREEYQLHTLYSGIPASTPAVQGELFYGVRQAVPSFSFRDARRGEIVRMYQPETAASVQQQLARQGRGLLEGGSAYSNLYTGGATEPHFCTSALGWGDLLRGARPWRVALFALTHLPSIVRVAGLALLEFVLGAIDGARAFRRGAGDLLAELKFIISRVLVSVVLREAITIGTSLDATRGLPIIQLNFLGYDEQSHRRGPGSAFAHWSLKGIDRSIQKIWNAARQSRRRDYQVWIYSDHGQEQTLAYRALTGQWIEEAVAKVLGAEPLSLPKTSDRSHRGIESQRANLLGGRRLQRLVPCPDPPCKEPIPANPAAAVVTALGPLGHIYLPQARPFAERARWAEQLVRNARIPLVLTLDDDSRCFAFTAAGRFALPAQAPAILGDQHPFLADVGVELAELCRHPQAGDFVISGWRQNGLPLTFALEHGAHAGPGPEETRAFTLLPAATPLPATERIRAADLRAAALHVLGRTSIPLPRRRVLSPRPPGRVRVMTYNVHSCVGIDGRLSPGRIARVIAHYDPDLVALQELDVHHHRSGLVHQVEAISRELGMQFHFSPTIAHHRGLYGDAILSRYSFRVLRADLLPTLPASPVQEPRGAIWVEIETSSGKLQVLNTHLGLTTSERLEQVEILLGPDWLSGPQYRDPCVLCGDFNSQPSSQVYRALVGRFEDAQLALNQRRPKKTWFTHYPLTRIDHVFVSQGLNVVHVDVPHTLLVRVASDHLPVVVDVDLNSARAGVESAALTPAVTTDAG